MIPYMYRQNYSVYNESFHERKEVPVRINFPIHTSSAQPHIEAKKYTTSTIDPQRNFLSVYEYQINDNWIIWDHEIGYVHLTGLWKAALSRNSKQISGQNFKTGIVKLYESTPRQYQPYIKRIRGGFLKIQGTWLPYDLCRLLARRFCFHIRHELVPIFGPDFPSSCLKPGDHGYGELRLDDVEEIRLGPYRAKMGMGQMNVESQHYPIAIFQNLQPSENGNKNLQPLSQPYRNAPLPDHPPINLQPPHRNAPLPDHPPISLQPPHRNAPLPDHPPINLQPAHRNLQPPHRNSWNTNGYGNGNGPRLANPVWLHGFRPYGAPGNTYHPNGPVFPMGIPPERSRARSESGFVPHPDTYPPTPNYQYTRKRPYEEPLATPQHKRSASWEVRSMNTPRSSDSTPKVDTPKITKAVLGYDTPKNKTPKLFTPKSLDSTTPKSSLSSTDVMDIVTASKCLQSLRSDPSPSTSNEASPTECKGEGISTILLAAQMAEPRKCSVKDMIE